MSILKSLFILVFLSFQQCYSQNEGNNWFFGNEAGLDFNSGLPAAVNTGQLNTTEGNATISDAAGLLLFYTDGVTVWNKTHQIMDNGNSLDGHESTSQSATIIQKPGSNNLYYIFTIDAQFGNKGFCYSIVDILANSGLGAVIQKNVFIKSSICEKITIVKHSNNNDYWVIVHGKLKAFYSYLVSNASISTIPVISNVGESIPSSGGAAQGIMKSSVDGTKLGVTNTGTRKVELFNFNNLTGVISNSLLILQGSQDWDNYYGVEFSPNGNLLYISNISSSIIKQFDLAAPDIPGSVINLQGGLGTNLAAIQLGPDQKIYISVYGKSYLGVIEFPNNLGTACNYQPNGVSLNGKIANLGLPTSYIMNNLIPTYQTQNICAAVNATFSINTSLALTSVNWNFGDGSSSNQLSPTHLYTSSGNFNVTLTANTLTSTIVKHLIIPITSIPIDLPTLVTPQTFCVQDNATLNSIAVAGPNIKWYNTLTGGNLLQTSSALLDGVTYFTSQTIDNCESLRIPVLINIENTTPPTGITTQTFCSTQNATLNDIVLIGSGLNWYTSNLSTNTVPLTTHLVNGATYYASQTVNNCESVTRIAVTVNLINTLNASDFSEIICDNLNDYTEIINLENYNANLISNVTNSTFEYYRTLYGAQNQTNTDFISTVLNYNLTAENSVIYVRITSNNGCNQIVELKLTLVDTPIITIPETLPICENNSITINAGGGFDTYNWSNGSTMQTSTIIEAGNYSVVVTKTYDNTICSATKNFTVVQSNAATITNIITQDWTDTENMITVNTIGIGNYEFSIDGENYQDSNVFVGLNGEKYKVYVRDKNGCAVIKEDVFLLMYPKYFSPNNDGYNDVWGIKFSFTEPSLQVNIFNRFGQLVKTLNNTNSWDGKYYGSDLPSSDYWFVVTRQSEKEYRGHFTLKR